MAKITTIRFEDEFHDEVQMAMIRRRVPSFRVLVNELLQKWLDDPAQDWKTLKEMVQETASADEFKVDMREAVNSAVKEALQTNRGFTLVELKSGKLTASGAKETASGEIPDLWHDLLDRIFASGHPTAIHAITHNLYAFGELVYLIQGRPDETHPAPSDNHTRHKNSTNEESRKKTRKTA